MPRVSAEDKCIDWLERLDVPEADMQTIDTLRDYLTHTFPDYTDAQIEALVGASDIGTTLEEHGITPVSIRYPWGTELRYGIQGAAGLWGYEAVQQIREEEEW